MVAHGSAKRGIDKVIGQRSWRFSWAGRKLKISSVQYKNSSWYIIYLKMLKSMEFKCIYHKNILCVCTSNVINDLIRSFAKALTPASQRSWLSCRKKSKFYSKAVISAGKYLSGTLLGLILIWGIVTPQREMVKFNAEVTSEMTTGMYLFQGINIAQMLCTAWHVWAQGLPWKLNFQSVQNRPVG